MRCGGRRWYLAQRRPSTSSALGVCIDSLSVLVALLSFESTHAMNLGVFLKAQRPTPTQVAVSQRDSGLTLRSTPYYAPVQPDPHACGRGVGPRRASIHPAWTELHHGRGHEPRSRLVLPAESHLGLHGRFQHPRSRHRDGLYARQASQHVAPRLAMDAVFVDARPTCPSVARFCVQRSCRV